MQGTTGAPESRLAALTIARTLTLASAVAYGETRGKVRYTKGTNPLRDLGGNEVASFTDRTVTNPHSRCRERSGGRR